MLSELSTKNKIFAGTSPFPAPGGIGFAYNLFPKNKNIKENTKNLIIFFTISPVLLVLHIRNLSSDHS